MQPERWLQIDQLLEAALERPPEERAVYLAYACAGDESLRLEVESLLRSDEDAENFIAEPAVTLVAEVLAAQYGRSLAGQCFGHYKILSQLGRGGMGEVYLAEDLKLMRKVAIKFLPQAWMADDQARKRLLREARAAAALDHPNICTIYEVGEEAGQSFIVMQYIEGETLAAQLERERLELREALDISIQVAEALQEAHRHGIIHRDIKPQNLMLTARGQVKVLDFGLAKVTTEQVVVSKEAETISQISGPGAILGTAPYMSPEQVRGEPLDVRTDIFSFGTTLYEMLSGRRTFQGDSAIEVMNAILKEEPPELGETNPKISPTLEKIVRRCLEKKPERRFQSASDLGFALETMSTVYDGRLHTGNVGKSRLFGHVWLAWAVAAALLLVTLVVIWAHFTRQPSTSSRVSRPMTSILPPEKSSFGQIDVSPDGRHLAFTAATGGKVQLWIRPIDTTEARVLAGTQGARLPFWSPDSRFIGFFADGWLKKVEVIGGPVQKLCEVVLPLGGAWNHNGVILFGQAPIGLLRISAMGGAVTQMTPLDRARQELVHLYPTFLPDGRHFFYCISSGQKETRGVYLGSLDGTLKRRLFDHVTVIKYMAAVPGNQASGGGWLVFGRDGALLAQPFDAHRLEFTGEPFLISDKVGSDLIYSTYFTFSVSTNGVLVFDPSLKRQRRQYLWVNRRGHVIKSLDVAAGYYYPWLSPDGKRFIADRFDSQNSTFDLWIYDVSGSNPQRFTFDPANDICPVWSPDGSRIAFTSSRSGVIVNLFQKAVSLAVEETQLLKSEHPQFPTDWSRNGRYIIYHQNDPKTKFDVWFLPKRGSDEAEPFPVVRTENNETSGTLSPDGRWLAYMSDGLGRPEVYVQSFPGGGGKRQVSNEGGLGPRWRSDGRELFYYAGDGKLMAAPVRNSEIFEIGAAVPLFEFLSGTIQVIFAPYAVTRDGKRFLLNAGVETEANAPLTMVVNWAADLKR